MLPFFGYEEKANTERKVPRFLDRRRTDGRAVNVSTPLFMGGKGAEIYAV